MNQFYIEKDGRRKLISEHSWNLGGPQRSGWTKVGEAKPLPEMPPTGQKENSQSADAGNDSKNSDPSETTQEAQKTDSVSKQDKKAFREILSDCTKSIQKDFLDSVGVSYHPASNKNVLVDLIGDVLNWDIQAAKTKFSIQ